MANVQFLWNLQKICWKIEELCLTTFFCFFDPLQNGGQLKFWDGIEREEIAYDFFFLLFLQTIMNHDRQYIQILVPQMQLWDNSSKKQLFEEIMRYEIS